MLGTLAFVAVGQEQHDGRRATPLALRGGDELVDDDLRAVGEVAKLGFPDTEHRGVVHRVAVVEAEDGVLGERAVIDAEARLIGPEIHQRNVPLTIHLIIKHAMAMAEGTATAILTGEAHGGLFEEQRPKGERLGESPVVGAACLPGLESAIEQDAADLGQHAKPSGTVVRPVTIWSNISREILVSDGSCE